MDAEGLTPPRRPMRHAPRLRLAVRAALASAAFLAGSAASASSAPSPEGDPPRDAAPAVPRAGAPPRSRAADSAREPLRAGFEATVRVFGRLAAEPSDRAPEAAGATRMTSEDIARRAPASLPELLATLPGVVAADETGNGRQLLLDLRGFGAGAGATAFVVDGVRLNEPDTNLASWELVPLHDVASLEVEPGPRGAVLGGGSLAGAVRVTLAGPPASRRFTARAGGGSLGLTEVGASAGGPVGRWRLLASASGSGGDGFRRDAGWHEGSARVAAATDVRAATLTASWSHLDGRWRQPGALTREEIRRDPRSSAANELDHARTGHDLLLVSAASPAAGARRTSWKAAASWRDRRALTLTTGRSGFGFLTRDRVRQAQLVAEASSLLARRGAASLSLRHGMEASRDRLAPKGFATDDVRDGSVDALAMASDVRVSWDREAVFAAVVADLPRGLRLEAGARRDWSRVARRGRDLSFATGAMERVADARSFAATTASLSVAGRHALGRGALWWEASAGSSFLAPSSAQLFAYPGFGSNPGLGASEAMGLRALAGFERGPALFSLDFFSTRTRDEIAYDAAERTNVNLPLTLRRGGVATLRLSPRDDVALEVTHARTKATLERAFEAWDGPAPAGALVPQVPRSATAVALDLGPFARTRVRLSFDRAGASRLSGDFDGSAPPLSARETVGLVVRHDLPRRSVDLSIVARALDLLDAARPTRGVETPPEPFGHDGIFLTPAPPRRVSLALEARW